MSLFKKIAVGYTGMFGILAFSIAKYIENVQETRNYPLEFERLIYPNNSFALFSRQISVNLPIEYLASEMFQLNSYQLEFWLSDTKFDFNSKIQVGQEIGHLQVESKPKPNQIVFRYSYPGFNYRLFLQKKEGEVQLGFVDYTDSKMQEFGCKLYLPLLLEELCRKVNKIQ
jgi:hypothetical protein